MAESIFGGLIAFTPGLRGKLKRIFSGETRKKPLCTERLKETFEEDSF